MVSGWTVSGLRQQHRGPEVQRKPSRICFSGNGQAFTVLSRLRGDMNRDMAFARQITAPGFAGNNGWPARVGALQDLMYSSSKGVCGDPWKGLAAMAVDKVHLPLDTRNDTATCKVQTVVHQSTG
jgi:hypothetical protein